MVGVLTQGGALKAYSTHTLLGMDTSNRIARLREARSDAGAFGEVTLPPESPAVGRRSTELALQRGAAAGGIPGGRAALGALGAPGLADRR